MSPEWDKFYQGPAVHRGWSADFHLIIAKCVAEPGRTLELGTGGGENIPMLLQMGADYHGIEGSAAAVKNLHGLFPNLKDKIVCADFTKEQPFGKFDLIVERASISHNTLAGIKGVVDLAFESLNPGGIFICADWFSTSHSEVARGEEVERNTRTNYPDGQFDGIGIVHFSDEAEIVELFKKFDGIMLMERLIRRAAPEDAFQFQQVRWISPHYRRLSYTSAVWDIVARRPHG